MTDVVYYHNARALSQGGLPEGLFRQGRSTPSNALTPCRCCAAGHPHMPAQPTSFPPRPDAPCCAAGAAQLALPQCANHCGD